MCYRKCECPHYISNLQSGTFNACGDCDYIKQMVKWQKLCRIGLGFAFILFIATTYLLF